MQTLWDATKGTNTISVGEISDKRSEQMLVLLPEITETTS